jgi:tripartite ATP-independent transporter DctM subunit
MNSVIVGVVGIFVLVVLFLFRMPVGFAMALVGVAGFSYLVSVDAGLSVLARDLFYTFSSYSLTVIPMFILMGCLASTSGIGQRLYDASHLIMGRLKGGLAMAAVAACAGFAAICGSTTATAAAMGKVSVPEMRRYGYDDSLATGCVAAAGTLGILIPPSTVFIVYGVMTEQSIGKLFVAGIIPGIILAGFFVAIVALMCKLRPKMAPLSTEASGQRWKSGAFAGVIETTALFVFVITGLFLGWFSPTQAGGVGAAGVLIVSLLTRQLTLAKFLEAVEDALMITCMVMVIVAGATVFGHFIAVTKIPLVLSEAVVHLPLHPLIIVGIIMLVYLIGGCFMDALALVLLTIPVFYPVVVALGFDPIWFGVMIVLATGMGVITPPVGVNVYAVKGIVPDVALETVFKGALPFLAALIVMVIILMVFPEVATFLPSLIVY